jgi:DNA replication protein DnaC
MLAPTTETGVSIERQESLLAYIRENPLASYVFSGPPGVGKTTLLKEVVRCAREAQPKNFAVYFETMPKFQRDTTATARGEYVKGLVNAHCIVQDRHWVKWGIFLDDFDKVSGSEFIRLQLFDLVDTAIQHKTQLSLSTNMSKSEFLKFFGDHIAWRIFKHCVWAELAREPEPVSSVSR